MLISPKYDISLKENCTPFPSPAGRWFLLKRTDADIVCLPIQPSPNLRKQACRWDLLETETQHRSNNTDCRVVVLWPPPVIVKWSPTEEKEGFNHYLNAKNVVATPERLKTSFKLFLSNKVIASRARWLICVLFDFGIYFFSSFRWRPAALEPIRIPS